jgi:shikimate kinase
VILKDLLAKYPYDSIIACGGGIVESEESRRILKEARNVMPIVNIVRERKEVLRNLQYLLEQRSVPDYGEDEALLLKRREPLYRDCASHVYVNLTCEDLPASQVPESSSRSSKLSSVHPLKYKQVGESVFTTRLSTCLSTS